jgi:FkbM family methyltransferase
LGAIHFSVDLEFVRALQRALPMRYFVETGTYRGDTAAAMAADFERVITIELSASLHAAAAARLAPWANVTSRLGSSPEILRELAPRLAGEGVLYWLDAHWCGSEAAGREFECPLEAELDAIGTLNERSIVLIDDARMFLSPPPPPHDCRYWPQLDTVVARLQAIGGPHRLWIINDVIVFAPPAARAAVIDYGRTRGVDLERLARAAVASASAAPAPAAPASAVQPAAAASGKLPSIGGGFNGRFLPDERVAQIFAHHLERMGIERVLDVGAHNGQFATQVRRFGFGGTIYSVEPQEGAYRALLAGARSDLRWIPLPRQAAGAARTFMDLHIAENGWSSSLRPVHANHVRAEKSTRTVGRERVFVNRSAELLRPEFMTAIEALKIDVQGFEDEVLEGYRPYLGNIRLLLLELSMVECYEGGPNLFALDRRLVEEFGFSRVSLEPSYYDDSAGVVQQYDGIYFRPGPGLPAPARTARVTGLDVGGVVTSVGGSLERRRSDGKEIGGDWLAFCAQSWLQFGTRVVSVAESPPPPGIEWLRTALRPTIRELLAAVPVGTSQHLLVTNADIGFGGDFHALLPKLDRSAVYYGHRLDVEFDAAQPERVVIKGAFPWGFDYVFVPAPLLQLIADEQLLPEEFRIGEPWWDYVVPLVAAARGFVLKRLPANAGAVHLPHTAQYSKDRWLRNGQHFLGLFERLRAEEGSFGAGLLQLPADAGDLEARLQAMSRFICELLP